MWWVYCFRGWVACLTVLVHDLAYIRLGCSWCLFDCGDVACVGDLCGWAGLGLLS